jgi:alpha-D-ribose 1-methylphosphonate 5-triphosphate synthase subunit PhnH
MVDVVLGRSPRSARLGTVASQRTFRVLLDAMSRPGRAHDLSELAVEVGVEPVLLPILALADIDTPVAVVDAVERREMHEHLLARSTGAPIVADLQDADLVVASGDVRATHIALLRRGDAWAPEQGARLALRSARIDPAGGGDLRITVTGPGARDGRSFGIDGIEPDVFEQLVLANGEHPAGVDTWLIADDGRCIGIPRSSHIATTKGVH